ncbi:crotonase/enoyl-CoA hydratase family protein [Phaeovulum sp. W22_SRMD_FR3]|uniref:crotonase/enoyl-CoA hydratase family protein n=1 Tax=Phaeovulum sp. W22_SRMD_FR3 TaxID=3240274 RepID=UPI003F94ECE3
MTFATIRLRTDRRGVAQLTLARPDKHNAMNAQMIAELTEAAAQLAQDPAVRVVVLSGEGKSFCAGGDLAWMRAQADSDRAGKMAEAGALAQMLGTLNALPKPLIGKVHGAAYGGGIGMVAVCDIVVAEQGTRFALTETRLGLIPATIGPFVLARMGEAFARQVFFNGKPFDATFLHRAGMVAQICTAEGMEAAIEAEVAAVLDCAPGAVASAKALCRALAGPDPRAAATLTATALADCWETEETREGIAAFFAKTTPSWRQPA